MRVKIIPPSLTKFSRGHAAQQNSGQAENMISEMVDIFCWGSCSKGIEIDVTITNELEEPRLRVLHVFSVTDGKTRESKIIAKVIG